MSNGQFDVERATAGLVMALFVSAALLLAGLLYFVLRDIDQRSESSSQNPQAVRVEDTPLDAAPPARPVSFTADRLS
jgi:sensor domain CHASE-containing protein